MRRSLGRNKPPLRRMLDLGQRTGRFAGTYILKARVGGNILLRGVDTPAGYISHIWIRGDSTGQLPVPAPRGTRFSFIADLEEAPFAGRVNLCDCREVEVLR